MPEVMIPLTASVVEFRKQAFIVRQVAEEVFASARSRCRSCSAP